MLLISLII